MVKYFQWLGMICGGVFKGLAMIIFANYVMSASSTLGAMLYLWEWRPLGRHNQYYMYETVGRPWLF